jgi:hypothetical protein
LPYEVILLHVWDGEQHRRLELPRQTGYAAG